MISIQDLGLTILSDHPNKMYIIGGEEYGVKDKYIAKLQSLYGKKYEYPTVMDVINLMSGRHLIPLEPAVYVVRYDETFISSLNEATAAKVRKAHIIGTLVCLYVNEKQIAKADKFLPEFTSVISSVNPKFIEKYLHGDFPKLDDRSIKVAARSCRNYGHARNICRSMSNTAPEELARRSETELQNLFGCSIYCDETAFRTAVANKDFNRLVKLLDKYDGPLDTIFYTILQTMIDMEKELCSRYHNSDLKDYLKNWKHEDVYYMFMHTYDELSKMRSSSVTNPESSLIYLFGILTFKKIPSLEVMHGF